MVLAVDGWGKVVFGQKIFLHILESTALTFFDEGETANDIVCAPVTLQYGDYGGRISSSHATLDLKMVVPAALVVKCQSCGVFAMG